jgi:hypothetical protein
MSIDKYDPGDKQFIPIGVMISVRDRHLMTPSNRDSTPLYT